MATQRTRQLPSVDTGPGGDGDDAVVNGSRGDVNVSHGVYSHSHPLAGMTVRQARSALSERMNLPPDAVALVGGEEVGDDTVLQEGAALMFVRDAGEKGGQR